MEFKTYTTVVCYCCRRKKGRECLVVRLQKKPSHAGSGQEDEEVSVEEKAE